MFWTELIVVTPHAIAADATTKETTAALVRASLRLLSLRHSVSNGVEINPETKRARSSSKPGGGARSGMSPVSGGVGTQGFSFKRGESRSEQGFRTESTGAMSADHITSDSSSYDQGQQWRDELSGFIRDAESVMERQQNQEGLSLARETAADFRRGEEARQQAEIYYTVQRKRFFTFLYRGVAFEFQRYALREGFQYRATGHGNVDGQGMNQ